MLEARLYSLQEVAGCKQACHCYDGALQTLTQIREEAEGKLCEWGDKGGEGGEGEVGCEVRTKCVSGWVGLYERCEGGVE